MIWGPSDRLESNCYAPAAVRAWLGHGDVKCVIIVCQSSPKSE